MHLRAYVRASTEDQDANRARGDLDRFAAERGLSIVGYYPENESGASLQRPEPFRLLRDSKPGDVLLIEQVDRLSRLSGPDWDNLKAHLHAKRVRVVALDLGAALQRRASAHLRREGDPHGLSAQDKHLQRSGRGRAYLSMRPNLVQSCAGSPGPNCRLQNQMVNGGRMTHCRTGVMPMPNAVNIRSE